MPGDAAYSRRNADTDVDGLLRRIASEEALWTAWDEVRGGRGAPGVDGVTVREWEQGAAERIERLSRELLGRRYRPRPLRRVWIAKRGKEEEYRALSVPAVRDRVAAGAAHEVIDHVLEPLFHDSSFAFRRGRGTAGALRRVTRLRDAGLRWVARADVDEFFDRIDQHLLFAGLQPLLPWSVRRLLVLWTRARVHDGADRYRLVRGVPQGTATSPPLANLYLTPFDRELAGEGVAAVRYADDLAAFAATEAGARSALAKMRSALAAVGLELNPAADPVRHFDQGFEFLGFELRGDAVRIAPGKLAEFRRHATLLLAAPGAGSMGRRIALLNRMVRGWRAYYRSGVPRQQLAELDAWLEDRVRTARLALWARERPGPRDLELAGLESLCGSGRRVFQPPPPPTLEGYAYRVPLRGAEAGGDVAVLVEGDTLHAGGPGCLIVAADGSRRALRAGLRALVVADGALCHSAALRWVLESGTSLRFVERVAQEGGERQVVDAAAADGDDENVALRPVERHIEGHETR
ncbi:MAG: prophage lambdaSa1 transcriptase/maturase family protein [Gemmatimonadetes bacterium]|nr:prophage lambdaSa1 transcriptase/maturase family protein [Gemmatimonadota bacterium]